MPSLAWVLRSGLEEVLRRRECWREARWVAEEALGRGSEWFVLQMAGKGAGGAWMGGRSFECKGQTQGKRKRDDSAQTHQRA